MYICIRSIGNYIYIYIYIYNFKTKVYMRNLLGWLETRLARNTLTCLQRRFELPRNVKEHLSYSKVMRGSFR